MHIFQIKTQPDGKEMANLFINQNFICIGYTELNDLTNKSKEEIREDLQVKYNMSGSALGYHLGSVNTFVNVMEEGDLVLITQNDWVYIGKIGRYKCNSFPNIEEAYHARYVEWLGKDLKHEFNEYIRELLRNRSMITKFKHPSDIAELDKFLNKAPNLSNENFNINADVVKKSLNILIEALDSNNEEVRVKAASELLKYSKHN